MVDFCGCDVDVGIGDGDGAHERYGVRVPCRSSEREWNGYLYVGIVVRDTSLYAGHADVIGGHSK